MDAPSWRWCAASVIGSAHVTGGAPCQDAHAVAAISSEAEAEDEDETEDETLIAAVADGAGSAPRSEIGARTACDAIVASASSRLAAKRFDDWDESDLRGLATDARAALAALAEQSGAALQDYACTLLATLVGQKRAGFLQIGDGAIVQCGRDDDGWALVFWPQRGEYANATFFLTDEDALERLEVALAADGVAEVALLSDGLESSVLNYAERRVHGPFFEAMFEVARTGGAPGRDAELSGKLADYLGSPVIDRRTSDDRTLVLATRRPCAAERAA